MLSRAENRLQKLSRIRIGIWLCLLRLSAAQSTRGANNALVDAATRRGTNSPQCAGLCRGTGTCHSSGICRGISAGRGSDVCPFAIPGCGSATSYGSSIRRGASALSCCNGARAAGAGRNSASGDRGLTLPLIPDRAGTVCLRSLESRGRWFRLRRPCGPRGRAADRLATRS